MSAPKAKYNAAYVKARLDEAIQNIISEPDSFLVEPGKDFTRKCYFSLERMIRIILGMGGQSLNKELKNYDINYGVSNDLVSKKTAFVMSRKKIKPELFTTLLRNFNDLTIKPEDLFKGYKLIAVDGSDLKIPRDEDAISHLNNHKNDEGYNLLHINAMFNLITKRFEDATVEPKSTCDEHKEFIKMLKHLSLEHKQRIIFIADRGYASLNVYEHVHRTEGAEYLIRAKHNQIKELKDLPYEEFDKTMTLEVRTGQSKEDKALYRRGMAHYVNPYKRHGKCKGEKSWDFEDNVTMTFRVVRIKINDTGDPTKDYETLITSLNPFEFKLEDIKALYRMRWKEETAFRYLKYSIGLVNLHSMLNEHVIQEIYAKLVMYNFSAIIAYSAKIYQDKKNKHVYAVNFDMAISLCMDYFRYRGNSPPDIDKMIPDYKEAVRPGRKDRRKAVKAKEAVGFLYRVG